MRAPTFLDAVDVGVKYYAMARFSLGELTGAALFRGVEPISGPASPSNWRLVIECATVRARDGATKKRQVDALNRAAGRLGALHPEPEFRLPEEWKGSLPKKIDQERTRAALTPAEWACLAGRSKADLHHILDAVGLGLKALGRR